LTTQFQELDKEKAALAEDHSTEVRNLTNTIEQQKVTIAQSEKRLREKDKKINAYENKLIDLQEETLARVGDKESELASSKQMYEHQIGEFRKHIADLEN